jgi:hypothetical protein
MSNNTTNVNTSSPTLAPYDYSIPFSAWSYSIQGAFILIANLLIVAAVVRYKALNKKKVCPFSMKL